MLSVLILLISLLPKQVVLVTDDELREATRFMFGLGFVTETSGCAAVAALRAGKITGVHGRKVACVVSGSNIKPTELQHECFGTAPYHI